MELRVPAWEVQSETNPKRARLIGKRSIKRHSLTFVLTVFPSRLMKLKTLRFTLSEVSIIVHLFWVLTKGKMIMTEEELKLLFIGTFNCTSQVKTIYRGYERLESHQVTMSEFARIFSIMLKGSIEEKAAYVFEIYDYEGDGELTKRMLQTFLQDSFNTGHREEFGMDNRPVDDTVQYILKKLDPEKNGSIRKRDFVRGVKENPLLLECCTTVFPTREVVETFKALLLYKPEGITFFRETLEKKIKMMPMGHKRIC